jgi:hypothetical protein
MAEGYSSTSSYLIGIAFYILSAGHLLGSKGQSGEGALGRQSYYVYYYQWSRKDSETNLNESILTSVY